MIVANAVYHDGKLEPSEPLELEEGQEVRLLTEEEKTFFSRLQTCKSLSEWVDVVNSAPLSIQAEGEGFDIVKEIDQSRRLTGFRMPSQEA